MAIELICIDIDGTLIRRDGTVPEENIQAIKEAKDAGIHVAIATGRPFPGIIHLLEGIHLYDADQYSVTQNGALIQNNVSQKVVSSIPLSMEDVRYIESLVEPYGIAFSYLDVDGFYTTADPIDPVALWDADLNNMEILTRSIDSFDPDHVFAKVLLHGSVELLDTLDFNRPKGLERFYTVRSAGKLFEIMNKETNKGHGVQLLAKHLHIPMENVMVLADGMNDLEMMQVAGFPVAMANAAKPILELAREVTKTNEEAGVAWAIRTFALGAGKGE